MVININASKTSVNRPMKILTSDIDLPAFFQEVGDSERPVLFLDYDGTLAPFKRERDQATPYAGVRSILRSIANETATRMLFVTGRPVKDLLPLLGLDETRLEIWGAHGRERLLPDGDYNVQSVSREAQKKLAEAVRWAKERELMQHCEIKPGCFAIHRRSLSESEEGTVEEASRSWEHLTETGDLEIHQFDGGIELRVPGRSKGDAVDSVLEEEGENATTAYLGDDLTDEDAFSALGNRGLSVLVREDFRETGADLWIQPPDELLEFLENWLQSTRRRTAEPKYPGVI